MKKLGGILAVVVLSLALAAPAQAQSGYGSAVAVGDDEVFIGEPEPAQCLHLVMASPNACVSRQAQNRRQPSPSISFRIRPTTPRFSRPHELMRPSSVRA